MENHSLDHIHWAAWGVIDIDDKDKFDRIQRRNYINRVRKELEAFGWVMNCGGSKTVPWYKIEPNQYDLIRNAKGNPKIAAGADAFKNICTYALSVLKPNKEEADGEHLVEV